MTAAVVLQSNFVGVADLEPTAGLPVIAALAAVAACVPARRVARVDPIQALRTD